MEKLKELRKLRKLKQQDIADALNIKRTSYGNYENGINRPTPEMLQKIAIFFNVSIDYLLGHTLHTPQYTLPDMQDIRFAFHGGTEDLTQGDLDEIAAFIKFKRQQRENENRK